MNKKLWDERWSGLDASDDRRLSDLYNDLPYEVRKLTGLMNTRVRIQQLLFEHDRAEAHLQKIKRDIAEKKKQFRQDFEKYKQQTGVHIEEERSSDTGTAEQPELA